MPSITVKNLPEPLYRTLKQQAQRRHRSLNGEIVATLEEALHARGRHQVEELLKELEGFHARMGQVPIIEIGRLRREGRP
ncbi:MAG: FitA-like ribbon-helix-helix domain-containing protein [Gammaproteobacteria bacterium]